MCVFFLYASVILLGQWEDSFGYTGPPNSHTFIIVSFNHLIMLLWYVYPFLASVFVMYVSLEINIIIILLLLLYNMKCWFRMTSSHVVKPSQPCIYLLWHHPDHSTKWTIFQLWSPASINRLLQLIAEIRQSEMADLARTATTRCVGTLSVRECAVSAFHDDRLIPMEDTSKPLTFHCPPFRWFLRPWPLT